MIISRTPMRVSFIGGGSDIPAYYSRGYGEVVSTAINRYTYITVNNKFDDLIRVSYSKTEIVDHVDKVEHNIIREAMRITGVTKGVEIVYMGDIPLGSAGIGLGSSSSIAVGVLNALYAYSGLHVSAERLAREACEIEIDRLGHPIGKQDQYAAAYGGFNAIRFNADESVFVNPIIFKRPAREKLQNKLLMFYTGIERISSTILQEVSATMDQKSAHLDTMVSMAAEVQTKLNNGETECIGEYLRKGWQHKKELAGCISNDTIDTYYQKGIEAGASGGKVLGAGGGGFLLFYCDEEHHEAVRTALSDLREASIEFEPQGSKIIYVND